MSPKAEQVLIDAMTLNPDERGDLLRRLKESLIGFETPEIAAAWEEEIAERIRAIDSGEVELLTEEEVDRQLREKFPFLTD
jgi:hypothetical protein